MSGGDYENNVIDWVQLGSGLNQGIKGQWTDITVSHTFDEIWTSPPHMWALDLYGKAVKIELPPLLERIYLENVTTSFALEL